MPTSHFSQQESLISSINNMLTTDFFRLSELGITEFGYRKFTNTGKTFGVCTKHDWNIFLKDNTHFTQEMNSHYESELNDVFTKDKKYFVRTGEYKEISSDYLKALHDHGMWNILACYEKTKNGVEGFYFISSCKEDGALANYFNHLSILDNFIKSIRQKINDKLEDPSYNSLYSEIDSQVLTNLITPDERHKKSSFSNGSRSIILGKKRYHFSKREIEAMTLMSHGLSYKEIGERLNISSKTVENYIASTKAKTGTNCRSQLVQFVNETYLKNIIIN